MYIAKMWPLWLLTLVSAQPHCSQPNFSAGDFNLTSEKHLRTLLKSEEPFLLGLSAGWCSACCLYEDKYSAMLARMAEMEKKVTFVRADVKTADYIRKYVGSVEEVPKLYYVHKEVFYPYVEEANGYIMYLFVERMLKPYKTLESEEDFGKFWADKRRIRRVLGLIYDGDRDLDSDFAQFEAISYHLASTGAYEVALIADRNLLKRLKAQRSIQFYDSIMVRKPSGLAKTLDLATKSTDTDTYFWVLLNSLELVDELTINSLPIYHRIGLPMLLLFLNVRTLEQDDHLESARKVAENHWGAVSIAWVDGSSEVNREKRKELGLMTDKLPAAAFNLQDERVFPMDESAPFTYENLNRFVSDFRENRLIPRPSPKIASKSVYEIETILGLIPGLSRASFQDKVLTEGQDTCVFFYSSTDSSKDTVERTRAIAQSVAALKARLTDLGADSVHMYRFDVGTEVLPRGIAIGSAPAIYLFPAFHKSPPYVQFIGQNHYLNIWFFLAKDVDSPLRLLKLKEMTPEEHQIYEAAKASLGPSLVQRVEADERVKDVDWL